MRVVGLDLGERRIGVAVSDSGEVLASPVCTVERGDDPAADRAAVLEVVDELDAKVVVVGLPLRLDGRHGPEAQAATREAAALAEALSGRDVRVETFDERLTTLTAEQSLAAAGRRGRARRRVVDQAAAAVMLQAWLDRRRGGR